MYEKQKFSARLAYNWREKYLISQSDCCIKLPIWQDAYGQLELRSTIKPYRSWDIFLDAQNLMQEETVLLQQVTRRPSCRVWFTNDLRSAIGVRYRFQ